MANIWEKAISILAGNLNSGCSYLITTVDQVEKILYLKKIKTGWMLRSKKFK